MLGAAEYIRAVDRHLPACSRMHGAMHAKKQQPKQGHTLVRLVGAVQSTPFPSNAIVQHGRIDVSFRSCARTWFSPLAYSGREPARPRRSGKHLKHGGCSQRQRGRSEGSPLK